MQFSERVTALTQEKMLPSVVDQLNNSSIIAARFLANPKSWSGESVKQPSQYENSSTGGSFAGMDLLSTETTETVKSMQWYIKAEYQSIVIPGIERVVNSASETQVIRLVGQKMDEAKNSMMNRLGTKFYNTGAGKDIEGLGIIVDDGTDTTSYGGLTRASNTWVNGQVTASGGTLTLDGMAGVDDNCSAAGSEQESPNLLVTTKAVWTLYESLLNPTVVANYNATGYPMVDGRTPTGTTRKAGLGGHGGFRALHFRGNPIVADDKATSGVLFYLNERYLEFQRAVDPQLKSLSGANEVTEGVYAEKKAPSAFQLKDFQTPDNQYGEVAQIILLGNFIARQPRRNGKLTGITSA